ncbi:CRISPR-associated protein Cas4 [Methylocystis sp. JAN1]|uniref:CRISPR-associated protein Cas4 n=1 Tax=Methylocystis sp. JAN1 TaxID=3397211 RepID=UPI003FA31DBD
MDETPSAQPQLTEVDDPVPLSALQHAVYCLRQAALIHIERLWEENRFTAEGRVLHAAVDRQGQRYSRGVRRVSALPLSCRRLQLAGVADLVEYHKSEAGEIPYPVEYKRGKPKLHRADEAQLCGQALCLEEMTGLSIPEGALFYEQTRRRVVVRFDAELRTLTERVARELREIIIAGATPPAQYEKRKCDPCSLIELCRPRIAGRSAKAWRDREIDKLLNEAQGG